MQKKFFLYTIMALIIVGLSASQAWASPPVSQTEVTIKNDHTITDCHENQVEPIIIAIEFRAKVSDGSYSTFEQKRKIISPGRAFTIKNPNGNGAIHDITIYVESFYNNTYIRGFCKYRMNINKSYSGTNNTVSVSSTNYSTW